MSRFEGEGCAAFARAARALNSSLDLEVVLHGLLAGLDDELLRPSSWSLLLREDDSDALVFRLVRNENDRGLIGRRLAPGEGITGTVMRTGETLLISDVTRDERFSSRMDQALGFATRSIIAVPLRVETRTIGVIEIVNALGERGFDRDDVGILESFADLAAIAISSAQAHSALLELTRNDPLSELRNSTYFLSCGRGRLPLRRCRALSRACGAGGGADVSRAAGDQRAASGVVRVGGVPGGRGDGEGAAARRGRADVREQEGAGADA